VALAGVVRARPGDVPGPPRLGGHAWRAMMQPKRERRSLTEEERARGEAEREAALQERIRALAAELASPEEPEGESAIAWRYRRRRTREAAQKPKTTPVRKPRALTPTQPPRPLHQLVERLSDVELEEAREAILRGDLGKAEALMRRRRRP
jgi:hypothetical protein